MRGWVKWALAVLVPVVVYVGAYLGCCLWPGEWPAIKRVNGGDGSGRAMAVLFGPALRAHRTILTRHVESVLEGRWKLEGREGGQVLEFRPGADGSWELWIDDEGKTRPGFHMVIGWRVGEWDVSLDPLGSVIRVESDDVMVLVDADEIGKSDLRYVRIGD